MRVRDPVTGNVRVTKRRRRYDDGRCPRELTFCCFQGIPFLDKDRCRNWFLDALAHARSRWPVDLWAWVLMPEHVHLLVAPRLDGVKVGRFAGDIKERTARPAIKWLQENAPEFLPRVTMREGTVIRRRFWQPGGGYDRNIHDERTLQSVIDYIHANPVRRGLCRRPEDWEWSSARWYAGLRTSRVDIDATLPMTYE